MMRLARLCCICAWVLVVPVVSAQTPPARNRDDLDVTMRVIVDPDAKVPDEIVRKIPLPKPAQAPATPPGQTGKPADSSAPGQQRATDAREQGREFGQQTAEQAKQRAEEARRNSGPPSRPPGPPATPPGRPQNQPPPRTGS